LVSDRCHLQPRRKRLNDALQLAARFEFPNEVSQVGVFHYFRVVTGFVKYLTGYLDAS
jgi:hypothetical protein